MIRRIALAAAVALGVALLVPAGPAQARGCLTGTYCGFVWYTDATRSEISGVNLNYEGCGGGILRWGTSSPHWERLTEAC